MYLTIKKIILGLFLCILIFVILCYNLDIGFLENDIINTYYNDPNNFIKIANNSYNNKYYTIMDFFYKKNYIHFPSKFMNNEYLYNNFTYKSLNHTLIKSRELTEKEFLLNHVKLMEDLIECNNETQRYFKQYFIDN